MTTVELTLDRTVLGLADHLLATVTVRGDSPPAVTVPVQLLEATSAAAWRIRPVGPATVVGNTWTVQYRLDPYQAGPAVPVRFSPLTVGQQSHELAERTVDVRTTLADGPDTPPRPITGIEELPPEPSGGFAAGWQLAGLALLAALVLLILRYRRRRGRIATPTVEADPFQTLAKLFESSDVSPVVVADRLTEAIRRTLSTRFDRETAHYTTAELTELEPAVGQTLRWCDAVKFGGHRPPVGECLENVQTAQRWAQGSS